MKITRKLALFSVVMAVLMLIGSYFLEISPAFPNVGSSYLTLNAGCSDSAYQKFKTDQFPSSLKQDIGWPFKFHSFNIFEKCSQTWYPLGAIIDLVVYFFINVIIATIYRKIESDEDIIGKPQSGV